MRISEVAMAAGVPTATVRYYERRGLIAPAPRTTPGYRQYGSDAARRLRFIKHAQELGFSLEEIQELLNLRIEDPDACARVEATTRDKVRAVRQRLAELRRLERTLDGLVRACERQRPSEPCPVLLALADTGANRSPRNRRARAHA